MLTPHLTKKNAAATKIATQTNAHIAAGPD